MGDFCQVKSQEIIFYICDWRMVSWMYGRQLLYLEMD